MVDSDIVIRLRMMRKLKSGLRVPNCPKIHIQNIHLEKYYEASYFDHMYLSNITSIVPNWCPPNLEEWSLEELDDILLKFSRCTRLRQLLLPPVPASYDNVDAMRNCFFKLRHLRTLRLFNTGISSHLLEVLFQSISSNILELKLEDLKMDDAVLKAMIGNICLHKIVKLDLTMCIHIPFIDLNILCCFLSNLKNSLKSFKLVRNYLKIDQHQFLIDSVYQYFENIEEIVIKEHSEHKIDLKPLQQYCSDITKKYSFDMH